MKSFFDPFKDSYIVKILLAIITFLYSLFASAQVDKTSDLFKILKSKDSIIFESTFNKCEIEKLDNIIAEDFEFYHDVSGLQDRTKFMKIIKTGLCATPGNIHRDLVAGSLEVHPLKNNGELYGAIQKGKHTFKEKQDGLLKTVGIADFTHLWALENNKWKLKRVLSYNHKPYSI